MFQNFFDTSTLDTVDELMLPELEANQDCEAELQASQVYALYIVPDGAGLPLDWTAQDSWAAVLDNTNEANEAAKYLEGIGGVEVPQKSEVEVGKGLLIETIRNYTLRFRLPSMSDKNRAYLQKHQSVGIPPEFSVWLINVEGQIFGGAKGVRPYYATADMPMGEGRNDIQQGTLTLRWYAKTDPNRAFFLTSP